MESAFFAADEALKALLPRGVHCPATAEELAERAWTLLALTGEGCRRLEEAGLLLCCHTLILPGEWGALAERCRARQVVTCGLSSRESLTFSSLGESAMVCLQRQLLRPDGGSVEPQELPAPALLCPAEDYLPAAALHLLLE
jgi:hypothetical protein